jgi:hypothetical protein
MKKFNYHNIEKRIHGKEHIIRKVFIKNGKGYKSITTTTMKKGGGKRQKQKRTTTKRKLHTHEIENIKNRKFIKGLFSDIY